MFNAKSYSAAGESSPLAAHDQTHRDASDRSSLPGRRELLRAGASVAVASFFLGDPLAAQSTSQCRRSSVATTTRSAREQHMNIQRVGSKPSVKGPSGWFTGTVRVDPLFDGPDPARVSGANVTFEPGARTAWHTHPLGQHIMITSGVGWVQQEGGAVQEVRPGDVVWFPPNVKHWHGASPTNAMAHLAIQEARDGSAVEWMEHVTDEQYKR
jgi:quercetin dioxygenase-like cupin family protein